MMNATNIPVEELPKGHGDAVNLAVDIADHIAVQSIDFAQNAIGFSSALREHVLILATTHAQVAAKVYAVHELTAVLRELTPEIAGAISEVGTDIGAGIAEGLHQALNTNTHENTDNH
jgi:hypothetical protein